MRQRFKRSWALLLSIIMVVGILPISILSEDPTPITYVVNDYDELKAAYQAINDAPEGSSFIISIIADIDNCGSISLRKNTTTILGNGHTLTFKYQSGINASVSAVIELGDKNDPENTLTITSKDMHGDPGVLVLSGASTINMYDGVTIRDIKNNNYFGGAVTIGLANSSTTTAKFHMYGGLIENCGVNGGSICYGGGVAVGNGGTFIMDGGAISKCYAETTYFVSWQYNCAGSGGGVFVIGGSNFTMNGGTIDHCRASVNGGGVAVVASTSAYYAHSSYGYLDSRFEMNGGTISNCTANYTGGGVAALGTYISASTIVARNPAAGDPQHGFEINGGEISGNDATEGGGVFLNWIQPSIITKIGAAAIKDNTAVCGAGVEVLSKWTSLTMDGTTLAENEADNQGGAIAIRSNTSSEGTHIKNCTITANKSGVDSTVTTYADGSGAGVYYTADSRIYLSGANTIQNNTFQDKLNNVAVISPESPIYIEGDLSGSKIGLSDSKLWNDGLTDEDSEAISEVKLTDGFVDNNGGIAPYDVFTSDHDTWYAYYGDEYEGTYTENWSNNIWKTKTNVKYKENMYGVPNAGSTSGQVNTELYYNPDTKTVRVGSDTGFYKLALFSHDSKFYISYKLSSSKFYIISEVDQLGTRYFEIPSDWQRDENVTSAGLNYMRCGSMDSKSGSYVYELGLVSNGDGYDYSGEVRLVRSYIVEYSYTDTVPANAPEVPAAETKAYGIEVIVADVPTLDGYTFSGWTTNDASVSEGKFIMPANDVSLSGNWTANGYRVVFDKNSGTAGTMEDQIFTYDAEQALNKNAFTRTGYSFTGWNTAADGSGTAYADKETVKNLTDENDGTVRLYAQWTINKYTVVWKNDDGTVLETDTGVEYGSMPEYNGATPTKEALGYTYIFNTWAPSISPVTEDATYTATYTETSVDYSITYDLGGGSVSADNPETYNIETPTFTLNNPTKTGYTFAGWTGSNGDTAQTTVTIATGSTGDRSYTAKWTANGYRVVFDKNSGTAGTMEDQIFTYDEEQALNKNAFTRTGYSFTGWNTAADGSGTAYADKETVKNLTDENDGTVRLYAQWTINKYTVVWKNDDGTVLETDTGVEYGSMPEYNGATPTKKAVAGYIYGFNTWTPSISPVTDDVIYTATYTATIIHLPKPGGVDLTPDDGDDTPGDGAAPDSQITVEIPEMLNGIDHFAYVIGYQDGCIRPEGNITRAEATTIFFRLLMPEIRDSNLTKESVFTDVDNKWFTQSIATMAKLGIVKGRTAAEFVPDGMITRAEFAAICARFDRSTVDSTVTFTDISGHWAEEEIIHAAAIGWINGYPDGSFHPDAPITRAEAMTLINRMLHRLPETEDDLMADMRTWPDNKPDAWYYLAVQEATNTHDYVYKTGFMDKWITIVDDPDWTRYQK